MADDTLEPVRRMARSRFGYDDLGTGQEAAIGSLLAHRDTLCVLPTGAGKSAIYQLVGLHARMLTLVISPLIALQRDQVAALERIAPGAAAEINSTLTDTERVEVLARLRGRESGFLFLAPEQLARPDMLAWLTEARPGLVVVDEAHCISEWGQDFRQDYLRLGAAIDALNHPPVLALTATASPPVRTEIVERLHLDDPAIIVEGFDRPNIRLAVESFPDDGARTEQLLERIARASMPGIVYTTTRKGSEALAEQIEARGLQAAAYHAGLKTDTREAVQEAFMDDRIAVIVATTAFGMGIDKPNVRFVYHHGVSDSPDAYYQEIGRAGRDGEPAEAILFSTPDDFDLKRFQAGVGQLEVDDVEPVLSSLVRHRRPLDATALREDVDLTDTRLNRVLNRLEDIDAVELRPDGTIELADRRADPAATAEAAVDEQRQRQHFAQSKLEMMRRYIDDEECRRAFLLHYFGEPFEGRCGNCDICDRGLSAPTPEERGAQEEFPTGVRVRHTSLGDGAITHADADAITVLFDRGGYRMLSRKIIAESDLLSRLP